MILSNDKQAEILSIGEGEITNMGIDTDDQAVLMMILSEGLYKDAIGSLIREYASNALDATREAGNEESIIVKLTGSRWGSEPRIFSVQDFGTGISPERMQKVVSRYAASTKRQDATQLGYFGLGMKSGLAYTDTIHIDTNFEGTTYKYLMYKGLDGTKIELLDTHPTEEPNGTTISLTLVDREDLETFRSKIKEQLCYFKGVFFVADGVSNDFTIFESENWKKSTLSEDRYMHLCLDDVYYPIDYNKLGIGPIEIPIGLKFTASEGIIPTPSREDIRMTPTARDLIKKKIEVVCEELVKEYNEKNLKIDNLFLYLQLLEAVPCKKLITPSGEAVIFDIEPAQDFCEANFERPTYSLAPHIPDKIIKLNIIAEISNNYTCVGSVLSKRFYGNKLTSFSTLIKQIEVRSLGHQPIVNCMIVKELPKGLHMDFLKDEYRNLGFFRKTPGKRCLFKDWGNYASYYRLLGLKHIDRSLWRTCIIEFQAVEKWIESFMIHADSIHYTEDWLKRRKDNRKAISRTLVGEGEIYPKFAQRSGNSRAICVYEKGNPIDVKTLGKLEGVVVYGTVEDKETLDKIYQMFKIDVALRKSKKGKPQSRRHVAILSNRDIKKLEEFPKHNWLKVGDFMKGKYPILGKYCTHFVIHKFFENWVVRDTSDFKRKLEIFRKSLAEQLVEFEKVSCTVNRYSVDLEFMEECLKICEENNLWLQPLYGNFNRFKSEIEDFEFLRFIKFDDPFRNEDYKTKNVDKIQLCQDVFKRRGIKMDLANYTNILSAVAEEIEEEEEELD